jgi:hypothetical protein
VGSRCVRGSQIGGTVVLTGGAPERRPTAWVRLGQRESASPLSTSLGELVDQLARFLVAVLDGGALHEVRGRAE